MSYLKIKKELQEKSNPDKAKIYSRFFKTKKGEYGYGDKFYGITVPELRKIAKKYADIPFESIQKLIDDPYHECRFVSLVILISQFDKADEDKQKEFVKFYIQNSKKINNWDLVDVSAPRILGVYLLKNPDNKDILYTFAHSKNLWQKRISILSTLAFIKKKDFDDCFYISEILLDDSHDLIHKAVGWMLREIGNIDSAAEKKFLDKYHKKMPRTMLRYAIEKFDKPDREFYMKK